MRDKIEEGMMAFLKDGADAVGAIRKVSPEKIVVYVENYGDFDVPEASVLDVHYGKVILDAEKLDRRMKEAIGHSHDGEDPNVAG